MSQFWTETGRELQTDGAAVLKERWCHCHSLTLASVKSRLVLPFWYRLIRVDLDKGSLSVCMFSVCCASVLPAPVCSCRPSRCCSTIFPVARRRRCWWQYYPAGVCFNTFSIMLFLLPSTSVVQIEQLVSCVSVSGILSNKMAFTYDILVCRDLSALCLMVIYLLYDLLLSVVFAVVTWIY